MNDEQIKEVMRLGELWATYAWKACSHGADETVKSQASRAALEAYLRTIGEPAGYSLPAGSMGEKKWAQLPKDCKPIGLVFQRIDAKTGAITEAGRVTWADWLAYPEADEPESVNAELLDALKSAKNGLEWYQDAHPELASECDNEAMQEIDAAIARAESAIETPAKVSPFADQQIIDYVKGVYAFLESTSPAGFADEAFRLPPFATRAQQLFADAIQGDELGKCMGSEGKDSKNRERHEGAVAKVSPCAGHAVQQDADDLVGLRGCNSRHGGMRAVEPCGYRMRTTDPGCTGCVERDEDQPAEANHEND